MSMTTLVILRFKTNYDDWYYQCISGCASYGDCICRRNTSAGLTWLGIKRHQWCAYAVLIGIAVVILLRLIFIILRKTTYGEMLMSAGFCMGILTLLLCASGLGLPMLMDPARCSIYYVYLLILTLTVLMDGILYLIFMRRLFTIPRNVLSFILTVSIVGSMLHQGMIKMPGFGSDYVSNGALTCLSNIIKENEDKTWTIVSANDETQMGLDHGWHYETITFLRNMEYMNKDTKGKMDSDVPDVLLGTGI